jgi:hypothetical protein
MLITFVDRIFLLEVAPDKSPLDPLLTLLMVFSFFSMLDEVFFVSSITICFLEAILLIELFGLSYIMNNVPSCARNLVAP